MADKKKVLGKGKLKQKEPSLIKKQELGKYPIENLASDEYIIKKFKSPKILTTQQNPDPNKKPGTPTPLSAPKSKFFIKRISETPKPSKDDYDNKRKSFSNIPEYGDVLIQNLGLKLSKYKQKNFELEEKLKQMEARFRNEENTLRGEIEKLNFNLKKLKAESTEREASLHQEIFSLRRDNEEIKITFKFQISQIFSTLESHIDNPIKEKIESLVNEINLKIDDTVLTDTNNVDNFFTGCFSNLPQGLSSSREIVSPHQVQAIALYDYTPKSNGELRLVSGDRIVVLNSDESNNWWLGRIGDRIGMFPRNCVMLD
ncbi:hypothetical protein SteCoe_15791 [Stentor coeruleus]|uniref:SH3 domain-containing protein n=1 Tax=Stentor coeruleus TaxID=5963 RepID=A0A1R2C2T2_9CILI|nr:hypothetical protein SteCoe_15791 [Stentor coeruleus]